MNPIIDSHCHLDFEVFDKDLDEVLQRAEANNVSDIIIPGVLRKNWEKIQLLSSQYENVHACYGLHPCFADQHTDEDISALEEQITLNACVAVGECGLDYRKQQPDRGLQAKYFGAQLAIASKLNLPVAVHAVYATEDVIQALKKFPKIKGMIHSYSGSVEQAKQLVKMGFYISLGGAITYDKARKLRTVAKEIPLEYLLIETDAPDQPDANHFSMRNEPAYLTTVLDCLDVLRNEGREKIAEQTANNTRELFGI